MNLFCLGAFYGILFLCSVKYYSPKHAFLCLDSNIAGRNFDSRLMNLSLLELLSIRESLFGVVELYTESQQSPLSTSTFELVYHEIRIPGINQLTTQPPRAYCEVPGRYRSHD